MKTIQGTTRNIRELLTGQKYSIDYYQRDYKWEDKQVLELIDDLSTAFQEDYVPSHSRQEVSGYGRYFLGSIIVSQKDNKNYIVDGQQRLTSVTLLLILLRNMQAQREDAVPLDALIFSYSKGQNSFNIDVPERASVMNALFKREPFEPSGKPDSVQTIYARYVTLEQAFPQRLADDALPYFIDWLTDNVYLVEITTSNDDDAYTIFETMNDRGLSLSPTDMLKGYLLANITDESKRAHASVIWKNRINQLREFGKDQESDFFRNWLRAHYAETIRDSTKGATNKDFEKVATEFHRWVREKSHAIGLKNSDAFTSLVERNLDFYTDVYQQVLGASRQRIIGWEHLYYLGTTTFTLQYMMYLAPLLPEDDPETVRRKCEQVAIYLDIMFHRRIWNNRPIDYSPLYRPMFAVTKSIRGKTLGQLTEILRKELDDESLEFGANPDFGLRDFYNGPRLHLILARMTEYIEIGSKMESRYGEYVSKKGKSPYEIEHIWANHPEQHIDEIADPGEFDRLRNRIGDLLLLPKSFNASYGDMPYEHKRHKYLQQNLLAKSLHPDAYVSNPGFTQFIAESGLPFKPHEQFGRKDLEERQKLYRLIAEQVWNPDRLTEPSAGG